MCCQRNPFYSTMLLYTYISRFSVTPTISNPAELPPPTLFPNRSSLRFQLPSQTPHACFHRQSGYTLAFRKKIAHKGTHGETGDVSGGGAITTLGAFRTFTNIPGPGACGTAMRLCASLSRRRRGPAGLRCSVCNLVMLLFFHSARRAFHTCKRGCGITTLGVLRVLSKRWAAACQKG